MAGFKQGALQLKKNDSELPADIGHIKVLVNTDSQLYTVDENGVSALIQGGGSGGPVYWKDIKNIPTASSSTSGVLTSADWNTFNDKLTSAALVGYATLSGDNTFTGNNRFNVLLSATNGVIGGELVGPFDKQYYLNNDSLTFTDNGSGTTTKIGNSSSTSSLETNAQVYNILRDGMNVIYASTSQTRLGSLNIAYTVVDAQSGVNINTDQTNINSNLDVYGSTSIHGNISANSFVTNGGTSAQFVAGDGELIYTSAIIPNIGVASSSTSGVLTSADWNNFSNHNISTGVVGDVAPIATYGYGTISIEGSQVNLHSDSAHTSPIITYTLTSATFTLTNGLEQYIVADYNFGSPIYRLENNKTNINSSNVVLIRVCWRTGNVVHSVDYDSAGSGLANKIEASIIQTTPYRKSLDGGLTLSETGSPIERTVIVTPAIVFAGTTPQNLSAFNSSTNKLTFASVSNGVWSYTSGTTQYNNTQYNPATGLTTLGNNNYGVVWLYRSVGNDVEVFYVLGDSEYPTIAKAQTSKLRSDISLLLRDHCVLIGRIIVQKGASAGVVENVADVSFASSSITNHNDLNNIQGGSVGEYYHLSATQYNQLTSGGDTSLHNHSFDRNRSNHTGTQLASTISDFTSASRMLLSATTPIVYTSATGIFSHSTIGSAGTYTKIVTDTFGHITSGSVLTSADIPTLPWSKVTNTPTTLSAYGVTSADTLFDGKYLGINGIAQGALSATQSDKLKTARTIATSGDIVGTATSFDGTANITIPTTLPNIVTANTKTKIVYNAKGQVTSGGDLVAADIPALGSIYQLLSEENQAMGYAGLDAGKKIYTSALPDSILGQLHYIGTWNATTNTPALPNPNTVSGGFYIVSVSGTSAISNISPNSVNGDWRVGDWLVSDGTYWDKVYNSDAISMFNGRIGAITPIASDYSAFYPLLTSAYNNPSWVNTLDWSKIVNEPTTLVGYGITSADTLFDGKYAITGHNHNGLYLTSTSALNPANVVQTDSYRFVTDTEKNTWNAKQNAITLGTTAQYFRGDLSLATFPTDLSSFTNGPGYITSAIGDLRYAPIVHNQVWSTITSVPTASTSTSGVLTSTDWNTFNNKQANLGFTPVQQGGGASQTTNKLYIGYSVVGALRLQVDSTDFGSNWPISITGYAAGGASDSAKLGNQPPSYYATSSSLANYLPLSGGTLTGNLSMDVGKQLFATRSMGLSASSYVNAAIRIDRNDSTGTSTHAGMGFLNNNVNAAFLYYDAQGTGFRYRTDLNADRQIWDNNNLTNLNQLTNGPGYITSAIGDARYVNFGTTLYDIVSPVYGAYWKICDISPNNYQSHTIQVSNSFYGQQHGLDVTIYVLHDAAGPSCDVSYIGRTIYAWVGYYWNPTSKVISLYMYRGAGNSYQQRVVTVLSSTNKSLIAISTDAATTTPGVTVTEASSIRLDGVSDGLITNNIQSKTNNAYNLGTPSIAWANVYSYNYYESGVLLSTKYAASSHLHSGQYLPLSGGTMTGAITTNTAGISLFGGGIANRYLVDSAGGIYLAVYGSANSGKSVYLETYDTDIFHRKNGTDYKIWDAGNLTNLNQLTNGPGYLTTTTGDARYSLTGHLHSGQYLPLSGGTVNGIINGSGDLIRNIGYIQSVKSDMNFYGLDGSTGTGTNGIVLGREHDGTAADRRVSIVQMMQDKAFITSVRASISYANDISWNLMYGYGTRTGDAFSGINTQIIKATASQITMYQPLSGTTATFSSYASFNGASMPAWGANINPIMLGGESFLYSYKSPTGTQPTFGSNFYYDGTNLKVIGTYTNSNYPRALVIDNAGSLLYNTSIISPVAGTTISDLTTKFSVSKEGNGTFAGTISEGGSLLSNKYGRLATSNTWTALNYINGGLSQQFESDVIGSKAISINRDITLSYIYASGYQYDGTLRQGDDGLNIESFESPVKISTTKFGLHTTNNNTYIESWYTGGPSYHLDLYTKDTMTLEAKKIVINGTLWANNIVNVSTTLSAPTTANTSWYTYDVVYIASSGILKLPPASSFTGSREIHISIAYNAILTINGSGVSGDSFNSVDINCSTGASTIMPYNGSLTNIHFYATVKWIFAAQWQIVYE